MDESNESIEAGNRMNQSAPTKINGKVKLIALIVIERLFEILVDLQRVAKVHFPSLLTPFQERVRMREEKRFRSVVTTALGGKNTSQVHIG